MARIPCVPEFFLQRGGYFTSAAEGRYFKRYKPLENLHSCWALTFFIEVHLDQSYCDHMHWHLKRWQIWVFNCKASSINTESRNKLEQQSLPKASRQHRQEILAENKTFLEPLQYFLGLLSQNFSELQPPPWRNRPCMACLSPVNWQYIPVELLFSATNCSVCYI